MAVLDVGCCNKKRGDIGIDIERIKGVDVICDAHHLPFQDNCFKKTMAYCSLEHLDKPYDALKEIYRVTNGILEIRYDSFLSIYNFIGRGHKNMMVRERFVRLPKAFFMLLNRLFTFRPLKSICRRAGLFRPNMYERSYHV